MTAPWLSPGVLALIDLALEEDLGRGDVTTACVLADQGAQVAATIMAKQSCVVFGLAVARRVFERVDPAIAMRSEVIDGTEVESGAALATLVGPVGGILAGERTALNFLMRLSAVATQSGRFARVVAGTATRVVDTRKTTPGWRLLEKAAVVAGGCGNHRADLGSGILIKDNHVAAAGGVGPAVALARARAPHPFRVEVEVTSLAELDEALAAGADVVLCDNMTLAMVTEAVPRAHARGVLVEVSGGVTLDAMPALVKTGADFVSAGALTHSAGSVDLSLELESPA